MGNKRRKLASKAEQQNGVVSHGPPGLSLAGGGGGPLGAGVVLTPDMVTSRSVQRSAPVAHLLPPASASSTSPAPSSSCSPHSGGGNNHNNNNNDVIVTGIYSLSRTPTRPGDPPPSHTRATAKAPPPLRTEAELPVQIHVRPASSRTDSPPLHAKAAPPLARRALPHGSPASGPALFSQIRKSFSPGEPGGVPRSWARQYGPPQAQPWPYPSSQAQSHAQVGPGAAGPHVGPQPGLSEPGVRIQQVFTLAALGDGARRTPASGGPQTRPAKPRTPDTTGCFSIAMETGDADDEYAREEELANMGAQIQLCPAGGSSSRSSSNSGSSVGGAGEAGGTGQGGLRRDSPGMGRNLIGVNPPNSDYFGGKGYQTSPSSSHAPPRQSSYYNSMAPRGSFALRMPFQGAGQTAPSLQVSSASQPATIPA